MINRNIVFYTVFLDRCSSLTYTCPLSSIFNSRDCKDCPSQGPEIHSPDGISNRAPCPWQAILVRSEVRYSFLRQAIGEPGQWGQSFLYERRTEPCRTTNRVSCPLSRGSKPRAAPSCNSSRWQSFINEVIKTAALNSFVILWPVADHRWGTIFPGAETEISARYLQLTELPVQSIHHHECPYPHRIPHDSQRDC